MFQLFLLRTLLGFLDVINEREEEPISVLYKMDTEAREAKGRMRCVFQRTELHPCLWEVLGSKDV